MCVCVFVLYVIKVLKSTTLLKYLKSYCSIFVEKKGPVFVVFLLLQHSAVSGDVTRINTLCENTGTLFSLFKY